MIVVLVPHSPYCGQSHCVDYIEFMLEQQLIAAVGKELQPKDFGEYMQFHARRLFASEYAPRPFVYAIRRPDHCPGNNNNNI